MSLSVAIVDCIYSKLDDKRFQKSSLQLVEEVDKKGKKDKFYNIYEIVVKLKQPNL